VLRSYAPVGADAEIRRVLDMRRWAVVGCSPDPARDPSLGDIPDTHEGLTGVMDRCPAIEMPRLGYL
jgi:predicted CoA-binding protein